MRTSGFLAICLLVILAGCKTSKVSTSAPEEYKEDLSGLRPDFSDPDEPVEEDKPETTSGPVVFENHLQSELDTINQLIIQKNREQQFFDGYTIQIYTGNSRAEADTSVAQAVRLDSTLEPTITYHQPSYKVKVGEYIDRLEAHRVFTEIKTAFPFALLIPERIKIKNDRTR